MPTRGKRYNEISKLVDPKKSYNTEEAIALVQKTSNVKFDASIDIHVHLGIDPNKGDQQVKGVVVLPSGSGKKKKIAVITSEGNIKEAKEAGADKVGGKEFIDEIKSTGKCDFDIVLATPDMMRDLAGVARVLGPKGLMPTPKNETVTTNIKKSIQELAGGKATFKNDDSGNIHLNIGRVSFTAPKLLANYNAAIDAVRRAKPASAKGLYIQNITLVSSMGPGVKVKI